MIWSDGISRSRMLGFVLDGRAGADFGVDHYSNHSLFETRLRHQNQKFLGFSVAGIRVGGCSTSGCVQSAEIIYENIIFDSCGYGWHLHLGYCKRVCRYCRAGYKQNVYEYVASFILAETLTSPPPLPHTPLVWNGFKRHGCKGLPYAPMSGHGCGAVVLLDFNDYDNLFDGAHFSNNSFAIYNDKMYCLHGTPPTGS